MKTAKFQLKNGMDVLIIESQKSPVVSVQMWVKNGSADETKGEEGLSHFVEHLVFKGSKKYGPGEIANVVEAHGGELNAYTSFDQTVFYVTMAKQNKALALDVVSQMMGYPKFDDTEVNSERDVVIEEIKRGLDSPFRTASQLLFESAYKAHPYRIPVIGYDKNIRKTPVKKIKEFYAKRYSPKNMFLIVAGDVNAKEIKGEISKAFAAIPQTKISVVRRKKEPKQLKPVLKTLENEFQQSILYLAFRTPQIKHKDMPALELLSMCLGQGDSSRLTMKMRVEKAIVNGVGCSLFAQQDSGLFIISAQLDKINLETALSELSRELKRTKTELFDEHEINRAKLAFSIDEFYTSETVDGLARRAGSLQFYMDDYKYFEKHIKLIAKLKAPDLQAVAKKYLKQENLVASLMTNEKKSIADAQLKRFLKDFSKVEKTAPAKKGATKKAKRPKERAISFSKLKPHLITESLNVHRESIAGLPVFFVPLRGLPTVSLRWGFLGGLRVETEKTVGVSELFSRVWVADTDKFTESQLLSHLDKHNISLSAFAGRNSIGLSMDYLSPFSDAALEAFESVLLKPHLTPEVTEREKGIQLNQIKSQVDNPSTQCFIQFHEMIFKNSPLQWNPIGNAKTLAAVDSKSLHDYHKSWITKNNSVAVIVGDFDQAMMKEKFEHLIHHLPHNQLKIDTKPPEPLIMNATGYIEAKKEQSHVILAHRGLTLNDPRRFALKIMTSILSGQGGRLFIELRDKNSLAYSVSPVKLDGIETGYYGAYIGCSPEKVSKAISMLRQEHQKLVDTKVPELELKRAKEYLVGRQAIELQRKSSIAGGILFEEIYGNSYQQLFDLKDSLEKVTAKDIQELAHFIFSQPEVISVVGPQNPFKEQSRAM